MDLNFFSFQSMAVVMFLLLEILPHTTYGHLQKQNTSVKVKSRSRVKALCRGGKWLQVGRFKVWQRRECISRREYSNHNERPEGWKTQEMDNDDFPSAEGGPTKGEEYDPTYGYEPYWVDGDWVFDKRPDKIEDTQVQGMVQVNMCGTKCSKMYTDYGKLCARNRFFEYKTFDNYCALKSHDCSGIERWMVLYRGKCIDRYVKAYYRWQRMMMRTLMSSYFSKFENSTRAYVGYAGDGSPGIFS